MAATYEQAKRYSFLIGVLYGTIFGYEATNTPITYEGIKDVMKRHCTETELNRVYDELARYASIVQKLREE